MQAKSYPFYGIQFPEYLNYDLICIKISPRESKVYESPKYSLISFYSNPSIISPHLVLNLRKI